MTTDQPTSVLFVCMGNICRSPLAENVFRYKALARGVIDQFTIDSAGTGDWHAGEAPDGRVRQVAQEHGVAVMGSARQVRRSDFQQFQHILCMDEDNLEHLLGLGAPPDRVKLLLDYHPEAPMQEVPDPYFGGRDGFELVFKLVDRACDGLLDDLLAARRAGGR